MSTNGIKVKYIKDNGYGFVKGKIYNGVLAKNKLGNTELICIIDPSGEEYGYPKDWFEIVKD
jgi:hypothetical protein